jgi:hypothetical protein
MKVDYKVMNVSDGKKYAGDLFSDAFKSEIPNFPLHFVLLLKIYQEYKTVGYVHYSKYNENSYLCGGLVVNANIFRKLDKEQRNFIKNKGGFAEIILRESFESLKPFDVIWGYVGDKLAEKVDLRVGFEKTHKKFIMAVWGKYYSNHEKIKLVDEVFKIGPF